MAEDGLDNGAEPSCGNHVDAAAVATGMRRPHPPARTILRPRDPVGELLLVFAVATFLVAALIGLTAAVLSVVSPV